MKVKRLCTPILYAAFVFISITRSNALAQVGSLITDDLDSPRSSVGLPFSFSSSFPGVCRALGYENYVQNSAVILNNSSTLSPPMFESVRVSSIGQVQSRISFAIIKKISCQKRSSHVEIETLTNDRIKDSGIYFSAESGSSFKGVCIRLGYQGYVEGTMRTDLAVSSYLLHEPSPLLKTNDIGNFTGSTYGRKRISSIACYNKSSGILAKLDKLFPISVENYPGTEMKFAAKDNRNARGEFDSTGFQAGIDFGNSENGVCKVFGFEKALVGTSRVNEQSTIEEQPFLVSVDSAGKLFRNEGDIRKVRSSMKSIICLNPINDHANNFQVEQVIDLTSDDLIDPETGLYFAASSSESGVCLRLGFARAIIGTKRVIAFRWSSTPAREKRSVVHINENGLPPVKPFVSEVAIEKIRCVKK